MIIASDIKPHSLSANSLAKEINQIHRRLMVMAVKTVDDAILVGELLSRAKAKCKRGDWYLWIETNLVFSRQTADNYLRCWLNREKLKTLTVGDLSDAYKALTNGNGDILATKFTGDQESFTPAIYVEAARVAMGKIDLDPASNPQAQKTVKADVFYTKSDNGLEKSWTGNVFLNPPYSHPDIALFVDKLLHHFTNGDVFQAILLTNDNTDTAWFQSSARKASAVCFVSKRINFLKNNGETSSPTNGQSFFYFGKRVKEFCREFSPFGLLMQRIE